MVTYCGKLTRKYPHMFIDYTHFSILLSMDIPFTPAGYEDGTFDVILSGVVSPVCLSHITDLLAEYARILKPSGVVVIREPVVDQGKQSFWREV